MASTIKAFFSLVFVLLLCPKTEGQTQAVTSSMIQDICNKTRDPSLCLQVMQSDLASPAGGSLEDLCSRTIDFAQKNAIQIQDQIKSNIGTEVIPEVKQVYQSCSKHFDDAISNLDEARESLVGKDYGGVNIKASSAMTYTDTCEEEDFGNIQLKTDMAKFQDLCSIILVISNTLHA